MRGISIWSGVFILQEAFIKDWTVLQAVPGQEETDGASLNNRDTHTWHPWKHGVVTTVCLDNFTGQQLYVWTNVLVDSYKSVQLYVWFYNGIGRRLCK